MARIDYYNDPRALAVHTNFSAAAAIIANSKVLYSPGVTIKEVTNQTRFRHWKSALHNHREGEPLQRDITYKYQAAGAFHPGKHQFVGYREHKPVAITSLLLAQGVAGIYSVITLGEARRKGIGTAMTQFALREAQHAGYTTAILQASNAGINIYRRICFNVLYYFNYYTYLNWSQKVY